MNFQASTTILNACTKKSGNLLKVSRIYLHFNPKNKKGTLSPKCMIFIYLEFTEHLEPTFDSVW